MKKQSVSQFSRRGEGLVIVVILVLILAAGAWWLFSFKSSNDKAARAFGRKMIESLTLKHDITFFAGNLGPQTKLDYPQSKQQMVIQKLTELGTPAQPIKIDENITFESQFFSPRGIFAAHLNYPSGPVLMEMSISHPVGKWQVDDLSISWKTQPQ